MSLGQEQSSPPEGIIVEPPQSRVLKAHPIEFAEKPYFFSLWDVPSAHVFYTPIKPQRVVFRPSVGLVWDVPLAHGVSFRFDDATADFSLKGVRGIKKTAPSE